MKKGNMTSLKANNSRATYTNDNEVNEIPNNSKE
jgi:hypothetical protein